MDVLLQSIEITARADLSKICLKLVRKKNTRKVCEVVPLRNIRRTKLQKHFERFLKESFLKYYLLIPLPTHPPLRQMRLLKNFFFWHYLFMFQISSSPLEQKEKERSRIYDTCKLVFNPLWIVSTLVSFIILQKQKFVQWYLLLGAK